MKILVIFTGGTIGSTVSGEYISPDSKRPYVILDKYNKMFENTIEWATESPYTILSENLTGNTMKLLLDTVKNGLAGDYDGIIVTHGSDTLQYSAAFLTVMLGDDTIPVMLVSSNYVLEDSRANGMDNFSCAVDFIEKGHGKGVFVPYRNTGENCKIHRGESLMPHDMYSDNLTSLNNEIYGEYTETGFVRYYDKKTPKSTEFDISELGEVSDILTVYACPGCVYPEISNNIRAVLIHAYHSGTICVESDKLGDFVQEARNKGINVFLVGANPETDYESCSKYGVMGIKVLPVISPVYAYIKLWINKGKWDKK